MSASGGGRVQSGDSLGDDPTVQRQARRDSARPDAGPDVKCDLVCHAILVFLRVSHRIFLHCQTPGRRSTQQGSRWSQYRGALDALDARYRKKCYAMWKRVRLDG